MPLQKYYVGKCYLDVASSFVLELLSPGSWKEQNGVDQYDFTTNMYELHTFQITGLWDVGVGAAVGLLNISPSFSLRILAQNTVLLVNLCPVLGSRCLPVN